MKVAVGALIVGLAFMGANSSQAEITLDGSVGPSAPGTLVASGDGFTYDITQDLGQRSGGNLIHSFDRFDIAVDESARFSGDPDIRNLIGRVTGGELSLIEGLLTSSIDGVDIWLINPAGVLLGDGATIDLPGSFHISTGDVMIFADGSELEASIDEPISLTSADPRGFGFVGQSAGIELSGAEVLLPSGELLSLTGGYVGVSDSNVEATLRVVSGVGDGVVDVLDSGGLSAGGDVDIKGSSVTSTGGRTLIRGGSITLVGSDLLHEGSLDGAASISLVANDQIVVDGGRVLARAVDRNSADVSIVTNALAAESSVIGTATFGTGDSGSTTIEAQTATLIDSLVAAVSLGSGNGGPISILVAEDLTASVGTSLNSSAYGTGNGGDMVIEAALVVFDDAVIETSTADGSQAGDLNIQSDYMLLENSFIGATSSGDGSGGSIQISAAQDLTFLDAFVLSAAYGEGDSGDIAIEGAQFTAYGSTIDSGVAFTEARGVAGDVVVEVDQFEFFNSGIAADHASGTGGEVLIRASEFYMDGSTLNGHGVGIDASLIEIHDGGVGIGPDASGQGGTLVLNGDVVRFSGSSIIGTEVIADGENAGDVEISAGSLSISDLAEVASLTAANGDGGVIRISANTLTIEGGGRIDARTFASGRGGDIFLRVDTLLVDSGGIESSTDGSGDAGNITVFADAMTIQRGGFVASLSSEGATDSGSAGSIEIIAGQLEISDGVVSVITNSDNANNTVGRIELQIDGDFVLDDGEVLATTHGAAAGGVIKVEANRVLLRNRSRFDSEATSTGDSGRIELLAVSSLSLEGNSRIRSNATVSQGGDIEVQSTEGFVRLDSSAIEASAGANGSGGNIAVDTRELVLSNSGILAQADAGSGGRIDLTADLVLEGAESAISADSNTGTAGTIQISAPNDDVAGSVSLQNENILVAPGIAQGPCAQSSITNHNSILFTAPQGLAPLPGDYVVSVAVPVDEPSLAEARSTTVYAIGCGTE